MKLQSFHLSEQEVVQTQVGQGGCPKGFTPRFPSLNPGSWIILTEVNLCLWWPQGYFSFNSAADRNPECAPDTQNLAPL